MNEIQCAWNVCNVIHRKTGKRAEIDSSIYDDLALTSMEMMDVVGHLEDIYDVDMEVEKIRLMDTVLELGRYIYSLKSDEWAEMEDENEYVVTIDGTDEQIHYYGGMDTLVLGSLDRYRRDDSDTLFLIAGLKEWDDTAVPGDRYEWDRFHILKIGMKKD